jgi:CHAT domain-containing protein
LGLLAEANARSIGGLGEYQRAVELYDEAAGIYQAHDRLVEQANAQVGKVYALAYLGRYEEALEAGRWASDVLEKHSQWRSLAKIIMNMAVAYGRQREDAKALDLLDQARQLYRRLGGEWNPFLCWIEQNRAIVLRNLGQFEASIQASQDAGEMALQLGQSAVAADTQKNMALIYLFLGRYNEALELSDQARDTFLSDGRQSEAILVELYISDCLLQLRRFDDVLDKSPQLRDMFAKFGTHREVGQVTLNEAVACAGLHRYAEALVLLTEARRLFKREGNHVWVTCADMEAAIVLFHQEQFEESLATAQECARFFQARELPVHKARADLITARAAAALKRRDQAHRLVTRALAVGQDKDIPALVYQCHHLLGHLAQYQGNYQKALAEYDQAIQELERLRGRLMVEFRADFLEGKEGVYEDVVALCLDLDRPSQGLEYAERAKSRALLDLLAYRHDLSIRARSEKDSRLVDELTYLRAERDRLYRRWLEKEGFVGSWPLLDTNGGQRQMRQDVLTLEKRIEELWHKLLIRNADYARDVCLWQVRTEPIQPYLSPDTLLLEYFIARGELFAFLVTAEGVQARRLPTDLSRVQQLMQFLLLNLEVVPRSTCSQVSGMSSNALGLLRRLYELLVTPLCDALAPYPRLIVVPHGPLHYLPFHALHDGQSFLLEHHEISYLPGASLLRYCTETRPAASSELVLGHSYGGVLPNAPWEAKTVATILDGQIALEEDATLTRLREMAPDCRVLHLATHGDFRPDNPLFSGLALADGWLTTLDIFNLPLKASLVTLSACQTGRNAVGGGDELLGLMRAFLCAGSASLLLSLWAVEDRSTAMFMETFYTRLTAGQTKGAALRQAQLEFIHQDARDTAGVPYAHPYFWAPFFLVGDTGLL